MKLHFKSLKVSIEQLINKGLPQEIGIKIKERKCLIHIPSKRFTPTFILLFIFQPEIAVFILTQEIKNIFVKELTSFLNWCKKVYKIKIPEVHTYTINDIDSPVSGKELIKIYRKEIEKIIKTFKDKGIENFIIDITGGTKFHSALLYETALRFSTYISYLYTREIKTARGISAIPGEEKLILISPQKQDLIIKNFGDFLEVFVSFNSSELQMNLKLQNNLYNFKWKIEKNKLSRIEEKIHSGLLKKIKITNFVPAELMNIFKKFTLIKFYFDRNSFYFPIDILLFKKYKIFTTRNFIFKITSLIEPLSIHKRRALIISSFQNRYEEEIIQKEVEGIATEISKYFKIKLLVNPGKEKLKKEIGRGWSFIHFSGHSGFDKKGNFIIINNKKIYATELNFNKSEFLFLNSCNSSPIFYSKVASSFPYRFLENGGKTVIGTTGKIITEKAFKFSILFYNFLIKFNNPAHAFLKASESFNNSLNYIYHGDINWNPI